MGLIKWLVNEQEKQTDVFEKVMISNLGENGMIYCAVMIESD